MNNMSQVPRTGTLESQRDKWHVETKFQRLRTSILLLFGITLRKNELVDGLLEQEIVESHPFPRVFLHDFNRVRDRPSVFMDNAFYLYIRPSDAPSNSVHVTGMLMYEVCLVAFPDVAVQQRKNHLHHHQTWNCTHGWAIFVWSLSMSGETRLLCGKGQQDLIIWRH